MIIPFCVPYAALLVTIELQKGYSSDGQAKPGRSFCLMGALRRHVVVSRLVTYRRVNGDPSVGPGYLRRHSFSRIGAETSIHSDRVLSLKNMAVLSSGFPNHFTYKLWNSSDPKNWLKVRSTTRRKSASFRSSARAKGT